MVSMSRRGAIGGLAAFPLVGLATGAFAAPVSEPADARLETYKGRYAIDGGAIIDGFFATPRGAARLDVAVIVHPGDELDARTEAVARRYALAGYLAVAPDLRSSYGDGRAGADRDAMLARLTASMPRLRRLPRGGGRIGIVLA